MPAAPFPSIARRIARPRAALLLSAALAAVLATGCGSGHSTPFQGTLVLPARTTPIVSIFEDNGALLSDPVGTVARLKSVGVNVIKLYLAWRSLAPDATSHNRPTGLQLDSPAAYSAALWAPYDAVVRSAQADGIQVDLTVGPPAPVWADGPGEPAHGIPGVWKPSAPEFGAFMRAVAIRYSGRYTPSGASAPLPRISFWSVWNEPNYGPDLAPQAIDHSTVEVSPRLYRGLLDAAWTALHATGHGADTLLIGEIAPRGLTYGDNPGNFSGMVPLRFVRALYCVDASLKALRGSTAAVRGCPTSPSGTQRFASEHPALFQAGGFAVHPYPQGQVPPDQPTPFEPDYADLPALPRLERMLDRIMAVYGSSRHFPLYSTEFGYHTDPPEATAKAVPVATAALYLNWAEYISWRDSRIRSFDQYLLADPARANALGGFATGLEYSGGQPKPTLIAYRMPLYLPISHGKRGHALEVWGAARPAYWAARQTGRPQTVSIEFSTTSGGVFTQLRRVTADAEGYLDVAITFPSSGVVRLTWTPPGGAPMHSRVASVTIG